MRSSFLLFPTSLHFQRKARESADEDGASFLIRPLLWGVLGSQGKAYLLILALPSEVLALLNYSFLTWKIKPVMLCQLRRTVRRITL